MISPDQLETPLDESDQIAWEEFLRADYPEATTDQRKFIGIALAHIGDLVLAPEDPTSNEGNTPLWLARVHGVRPITQRTKVSIETGGEAIRVGSFNDTSLQRLDALPLHVRGVGEILTQVVPRQAIFGARKIEEWLWAGRNSSKTGFATAKELMRDRLTAEIMAELQEPLLPAPRSADR